MFQLGLFVFMMSVGAALAAFTNIQTSTYDDIPQDCVSRIEPHPFIKIGSKYYLVEAEKKMNWYDAAHYCKANDAELVIIETAAEMDAISNYLIAKNYSDKWFWTSANDLGKEGTFKLLGTGDFMGFTKWSPGQPDNAGGVENCVHLWLHANKFYMNDLGCKDEKNFICQMKKPKTITFTVW